MRVTSSATISGPFTADGLLDYPAAINLRYEHVAPQDNAAVVFHELVETDPKRIRAFRTHLGLPEALPDGPRLISLDDYHAQGGADLPSLEELHAQFDEAERRPWRAKEFPALADWLDRNEAALARLAEGAERPDFFALDDLR